jgi:ATP-dependent DNA helicase RecG
MKAYISYDGLQRVESYLFPAPALREALLNAVVHKDYSSGNPVQISVYEDKIIFWNAGRLPDELSLELLQKKHPSIPYNPLVASAFFRAGYIEAWGRGIEKINNECKMAGVPAPEINYEFAGLMITFQARIGETGKISPETTPKTRGKTSGKTPDAILFLLDENPFLSIPEIAERINKSESAVERAIRKLREEGHLKRFGPAICVQDN